MNNAGTSDWNQWFQQFDIAEVAGKRIETIDASEVSIIQSKYNFLFPEEYLKFCMSFGTCLFFNATRVYCPNKSLSADIMYSTQQELLSYKGRRYKASIDSEALGSIENIVDRSGIVFAEGREAKIYVFDTSSYLSSDRSCDIWSANGEGSIESFVFLGRSFFDFFVNVCLDIRKISFNFNQTLATLPKQEKRIIRFDSNEAHSILSYLDV